MTKLKPTIKKGRKNATSTPTIRKRNRTQKTVAAVPEVLVFPPVDSNIKLVTTLENGTFDEIGEDRLMESSEGMDPLDGSSNEEEIFEDPLQVDNESNDLLEVTEPEVIDLDLDSYESTNNGAINVGSSEIKIVPIPTQIQLIPTLTPNATIFNSVSPSLNQRNLVSTSDSSPSIPDLLSPIIEQVIADSSRTRTSKKREVRIKSGRHSVKPKLKTNDAKTKSMQKETKAVSSRNDTKAKSKKNDLKSKSSKNYARVESGKNKAKVKSSPNNSREEDKVRKSGRKTKPARKSEQGHMWKNLFECDECDRKFPDEDLLKIHRRNHKVKKAICKTCGVMVKPSHRCKKTVENLVSEHCDVKSKKPDRKKRTKKGGQEELSKIKARKIDPKMVDICNECDAAFFSRRQLARHLQTHVINIELHTCSVCDLKFDSRQSLLDHEKSHAPKKSSYNNDSSYNQKVVPQTVVNNSEAAPLELEIDN